MSVPRENIERIVKKVADYLEIKDTNFAQEHQPFTSYFGTLICLTINGLLNEKQITKKLLLKIAQNSREPDFSSTVRDVFKKELYFYQHLLPLYRRLVIEDLHELVPDCYLIEKEPEPLIAMKDMSENGYKNVKEMFDKEHFKAALQALGKLHAASIVIKENKKKDIEFDENVLRPYSEKYPEAFHISVKKCLFIKKNLFKNTKYKEYLEYLRNHYDHYLYISTSKARRLVYGHGDVWIENILFKYKDDKIVSACLIDFQQTRLMCPAQDFLHSLITSVQPIARREHLDTFLNTYINSLHETLNVNGIHISYSKDDFVRDIKLVAPTSVSNAVFSFSLWSGLEKESIVPSKNIADDKNIATAQRLFKENVINVLDDLQSFGYINLSRE